MVKVGIDELLDVTVSVENREENSYNSRVILTYPAELSYRKFTSLQVRPQDHRLYITSSSSSLPPILIDLCFSSFVFNTGKN